MAMLAASCFAAFDGPSDWSASQGHAATAICAGPSAFWGNPSGILSVQSWGVSADWHREWEMDQLSTGRLAGVLASDWGTLAIGGSFTGDSDLFTENIIGIAYGRQFWKVNCALKTNIGMAKTCNWSANAFMIGVGADYPTGKVVTLGLWADNITASKLDGNPLPVRGAVGLAYRPTDWVNIYADYYIEDDYPATMRFGQETIIADPVSIRGGVNFRPNSYHLGIGILYRDFELTWSYLAHPELGSSLMFGMTYER